MKTLFIVVLLLFSIASTAPGAGRPTLASWYGEDHRGRLMANGRPFDPDKLTAASWFYPLGTKVRVTLKSPVQVNAVPRSVLVTITDRGPARRLVRLGRKIDLAAAAFKQLANPDLGLVEVTISPERSGQM
jgi:rare lipoprotein A